MLLECERQLGCGDRMRNVVGGLGRIWAQVRIDRCSVAGAMVGV